MKYTLKKYTSNDYDYVYNLKKQVYISYVEDIWGPWDDQKQHEFFDNYIKEQSNNISIIMHLNQPVGFYDYKLTKNTYEIVNICIDPTFQGKGIGSKILNDVINNNSDKDIILQHFIKNPVNALYKRLGFIEYDRNKTHIKMILKSNSNN